jgi:photosystem II stability/assembly factor-like uncharacterized protein
MTETAMVQRRPTRLAAFALALMAGAGAAAVLSPPVRAQGLPAPGDGFTWERVGDVPIDVFDLAFGRDSTLWATGDDGPYRLDLSGGPPGVWVLLRDFPVAEGILPLGCDTLVTGGGRTYRSTDGGGTWAQVYGRGRYGLYEVPAGYPFTGRVLTGDYDAIAYSTDRAASFTAAVVPAIGVNPSGADGFAAFPPGSAHPGRVLAAGRWGVTVSDDGGATFRESALWGSEYYGEAIAVVERPGGGVAAVMAGYLSAQPDYRVWRSDDDGETWAPEGGHRLPEGPPFGVGGGAKAVLPLGGSSALVVLGRGTVYRTDDAGVTWEAVGRAPEIDESIFLAAAALGLDGRLYVGLAQGGIERGWVWRTNEVLTAAVTTQAEPVDPPVVIGPSGGSFQFRVTLRNQTSQPQSIEAWSEASGPLTLSPVIGPRSVMLPPGATLTRTLVQRVPGAAPPGTYTYTVAVGDFPGGVVSSDSFTVVKQGTEGSGDGAEGWAVSGWGEAASDLPEATALHAAYPNPAAGVVTLRYDVAEGGPVRLAVYDALGRAVVVLADGAMEPGRYAAVLDGDALPAGVYLVRMEAGAFVQTHRVTLVR